MRLLAFLGIMGVVLILATLSPFAALLAYLWYGLFRPESWLYADVQWLRLSLLLGAILVVRSLLTGNLPTVSHRLMIGALLFLATALVAQVNASNQAVGWAWIDFLARLLFVCMLLVTLTNTKERFFLVVLTIAASFGAITSNAGVMSLLQGGVRFMVGPEGAFVDNNGYALAAVMITPLLVAAAETVPARWRFRRGVVWALRIAAALTVILVISTYSRGGFLALAAGTATFVFLFYRKRATVFVIFALAGLAAAPFITLPTGYTERLTTIRTFEEVGETSAISRIHFWRVAWDIAKANPLGVGLRNFDSVYDRYDFLDGQYGTRRSVHSSHLQVLSENGFAGFALWIFLFLSAGFTCLRLRRIAARELAGTDDGAFVWAMASALAASMAAFLIGGSFIALALNDLTWLTFALVAALDRVTLGMVAEREPLVPIQPSVRADVYGRDAAAPGAAATFPHERRSH